MRVWCHQIWCRQGISLATSVTFTSPVVIFSILWTANIASCEILRARKWWICLALDSWIFRDQWPQRAVMSHGQWLSMVSLASIKTPWYSQQVTGTAARTTSSARTPFMLRYRTLLLVVRQKTAENYLDWGFSVLFPHLWGKCQGTTRKDGAQPALLPN